MKKRLIALLVAGMIATASLTGCGESISNSDVVATRGDIEVNAKLYNFFARYMQAQYESYYKQYVGDDMWAQEAEDGLTYEQSVKNSMIENVETLLVLEQHMGDVEVSLTDAEKQVVSDLADQFIEDNSAEDLKIIGADKEIVERALTLVAIQNKMVDKIGEGADTNVSDEEAAQKKMQYVSFSLKTKDAEGNSVDMTDEEKAEVEEEAEKFIAEATVEGDFEAYGQSLEYNVITKTFDATTTAPIPEVIEAADKLSEGEISGVIKGENAYYVVKLVSAFDEEATADKKDSIIEERKLSLYQDTVKEWLGDTETEINEEVFAKISFLDPIVSMKMEEEEAAE